MGSVSGAFSPGAAAAYRAQAATLGGFVAAYPYESPVDPPPIAGDGRDRWAPWGAGGGTMANIGP